MNLRKILFPAFIGLFLLSFAADARYVFVLPPTGAANPVIQGFSENFISMGPAVAVPGGTNKVFTNLDATKAILISANTTAPVSFLNIQGGQLVGPVRSLSLEGKAPTAAILTPDGSKLLVLAGAGPGALFVVDLQTEVLAAGGRIQVLAEPRDLVVTADSRLAFIVSIQSRLTVVDLATGVVVNEQQIPGVSGNLSISISPAGSVYVTSQNGLTEYSTQAPYTFRGKSQLNTQPEKLYFSPDGRYALAKNIGIGAVTSLVAFDLGTRTVDAPAGTQVSAVPVTAPNSTAALQVDELTIISDRAAIAYVASLSKLFLVQYPALSVSEINLAGIGSPLNVTGVAVSNEFPITRNLYYNSNGVVSRHDLLSNNSVGTNVVAPGSLAFGAAASIAAVTDIVGYGGNETVAPNSQLRPYFVRVADSQGRPVYNAPIAFSTETVGVILSAATAITNMNGYAQVTVTAPPTNGDFVVRAAAGTGSVTIKSTVAGGTGGGPGGPGTTGPRIIRVSGDGQLRRIFDGFTDPLVVRVEDAAGNPVAGKQITWTEQGGVSFSSPLTTTTDANGLTEAHVIPAGFFVPGVASLQYTITANSDIGNTVFTLTAFPVTGTIFNPTPQIELKKPTQDNRTLTVKLGAKNDDAIRVLIFSGGGNNSNPTALSGVALNVSTGTTDPAQGTVAKCDGGTPLSGADGFVSCNLIATGRLGSTALKINVGGLTNFDGVILNVTPGDPIAPVIKQGNNQTGKAGATLPVPLLVNIGDAFGNPLSGTAVAWTVSPPNAVTLTNISTQADSNGNASARVLLGTTAGTVQVRATAGGKESVFNITIESLATGFVKVSGDNQPVVPINQVFPSPLIVQVNDAQNRPVAGASVQWAVTGGATLSGVTVATGADGRSQATVTAGSFASPITVTATLSGFTPITFQLQSRLPGPVLTAASFLNWATNEAGLAPGNLVLITGPGIAPNLRGTVNASLLTGSLPYLLSDVTVKFVYQGGEAFAPIYRVSNENNVESILVQVPFEVTGATATAEVNVGGGSTTVTAIPVRSASPGLLEDMIAGRRAAVAIRPDGSSVTPTNPALLGEVIRMYAIGLGQTTPAWDTNRVGSVDQKVASVVTVGLDGQGFEPTSVHSAENLVGVYEIEFRIPMTATLGTDRPIGFLLITAAGDVLYPNTSVLSIGQ